MKISLWTWTTKDILSNRDKRDELLREFSSLQATDIFLYLHHKMFIDYKFELYSLVSSLNSINVRVWALEGDRSYLSDKDVGPEDIYKAVNNLIDYNHQAPENAKIYGIQTDIEVIDTSDYKSFHNGKADSKLNRDGGGVWFKSEYDDRRQLLHNWIKIHDTLKHKLRHSKIKLGAALPWWLDNYEGEPLSTIYNNKKADVMTHFIDILDEMHFMTYNTYSENVIARMTKKLELVKGKDVLLSAGMETIVGYGQYVSYGDTVGKQSQTALKTDLATIEKELSKSANYKGMCIHDYNGWMALPQ